MGDDLRRLFARFVQAAAILAVLAALVGYVNLARYALGRLGELEGLIGHAEAARARLPSPEEERASELMSVPTGISTKGASITCHSSRSCNG